MIFLMYRHQLEIHLFQKINTSVKLICYVALSHDKLSHSLGNKWFHTVERKWRKLVVPPGGQISYLCKWRHLVAKFLTNASGATWWPISY